ncbi:MAG: hypothetical protein ACI4TF_00070 [Oliverpabstia sp.]
MKMKSILSIITICTLLISFTGCSTKDTAKEPEPEKSENQTDEFNATDYASAYLNCYYKGDVTAYSQLSGESEDTLLTSYNDYISSQLPSFLEQTQDTPGTELVSPQLYQDYTDLWKNIFDSTKYQVINAEQTDDYYTITVETQQMELYTRMQEIIPDKIEQFYETNAFESDNETTDDPYQQMMLDTYQDALQQITYAEPKTAAVSLVKTGQDTWEIPQTDLDTLNSMLIDLDVAENGFLDADPENLQTEATPNQDYPENLDQVPSYQVGESITLRQDNKDMATFCINSVEVTDERSDFDSSNPEKVIVINYTYQNIGYEDPILYDQMSFQVLDGKTVCSPYYIENLIPADIASKDGDPVTASLSYQVSGSCQEVIIYVNGVQIVFPFQVKADLS